MPTVSRPKRRRKLAAGAAVAIGAALVPEASADVYTVNTTGDVTAVDGQCTLREAIENANVAGTHADCVAVVAAAPDAIAFSLTLPATITLGGTAIDITDALTINGPGQTNLTIDANDLSRIFTIDDSVVGNTVAVTIADLTLANGDGFADSLPGGGAILTFEDLTLTNVTATNNLGTCGGVIESLGADLTVTGSTLNLNESMVCGGAISFAGGNLTLSNSSVTNNTAALNGGAIAVYYSELTVISNATITGNEATNGNGGGLYFYSPQDLTTIEDSVISGNSAPLGAGGGVFIAYGALEGPSLIVRDTTISGNTASDSAGLYIYDLPGYATLERVRIMGNTATSYAGGAGLFSVDVTVVESEISGNQADQGAGLYAGYSANLTLENSTIANNTATTDHGGLVVSISTATINLTTISGNTAGGSAGNVFIYGSTVDIDNSIIANGTAAANPDLETSSSSVTIDYSLVRDTTGATFTGANNLPPGTDPLLGPLQNNGGPTQTMKPAGGSPVINAGDPAFTPPPAIDQRGFTRPVNTVDMGAVEVNPGTLALDPTTYNINEAAGFVTVTVTRTGGADGAVSVNYTTSPGTAAAGADYTAASGTLNWADGDAAPKTFNVTILEDLIFEGNELFNVGLNTVVGATLGTSAGTVTIVDNDTAPTISIQDGGALEGNAGTTPANFTVTLSNPTTQTVTVDFGTAGVSAASGTDFQPATGTVTFNPLVTSQGISVNVIGDLVDEPNETFTVTLTNPNANATILDGSATGTITDDDATPALNISDVSQVEGTGGATNFVFTVSLTGPSSQTVTVDFATAGVSALSGTDFSPNSGTLTFDPLVTSQQVTVSVTPDAIDEANETFTVTLSNPSATATISDGSGTGTILDDDGAPALNINDVSLAEGNAGTTNFVFTVTLSPASGQPVTVDFATQNGSATAGSDYTATTGTLTFAAGDTSETITVPVTGDATFEPDETFNVVLSNAPLASIGDGTGLGTILNDDAAPSADLGVTKAVQGTGPFFAGQNATFTITVSNAGPATAANVQVQDTLPAGLSFVSAVPTSGSCSGTTTVVCNIGTLNNGGSASVTLTVLITQAGSYTNTATASSDLPDPSPASGNANFVAQAPAVGDASPTLSEWMLLALASALAAIAATKLKP